MKLLIDLLPCQTNSRFRGIGRYTNNIVIEMAKQKGENQIFTIADVLYRESFEDLRQQFNRILPPGSFLPYYHRGLAPNDTESNNQIAVTMVKQAYQVLSPDVCLYPSVFEGWCEQGIVPLPEENFPQAKRVAILYDFIPLIFSDRYLNPNPDYKKWYLRRFKALKNFDLLLAISDSTRLDAINYLGFDPSQVVNIHAAIDPKFRKLEINEIQAKKIFNRFNISRPYIFYTGNVEPHKNFDNLLKAFAELPSEVRKNHQIVFTHTGDRSKLNQKLTALGLSEDTLITTGHVEDEELVALYNLCKLFVFPSLYEGFGLPVLEAMACGAPVVASNNSSLPEVTGRDDILFDGSNPQSIAEVVQKVLTNEQLRAELSEYGINRSKMFTWEESAGLAWEAIEELSGEDLTLRTNHACIKRAAGKKRIAFVSPLPPQKSGIAQYSADLLPYLSKEYEIDLFVEPEAVENSPRINGHQVYPFNKLLERRKNYETVVYHFGNSQFHTYMLDLLRQFPGVVVLHDFYLSNIPYVEEFIYGKPGFFKNIVDQNHGLRGLVDLSRNGVDFLRNSWPMNWEVFNYAQEVIVHSLFQEKLIKRYYGNGWTPRLNLVKQIRQLCDEVLPGQKQEARRELQISDNSFVFCSFGFTAPTKLNHLILEAFRFLANDHSFSSFQLIFVGELEGGEYGQQMIKIIQEANLSSRVRITGYVNDSVYEKYLKAADCAIQLRTGSRGETSRSVLDCIAYGLPVILNAHATFNDYSEQDVYKLPDRVSVVDLRTAMVKIFEDEAGRMQVIKNAKAMLYRDHSPEKITNGYIQVIERAIRTDERQLFAPVFDNLAAKNCSIDEIHIEAMHAAANLRLRNQPRLLVDVSDISKTDWRGGIQRVLKSLVREWFNDEDQSYSIELVRFDTQLHQPVRSCRFVEKVLNLPDGSLGDEIPIELHPGDILFMLDANWREYDQYLPTFEQLRKLGGRIATIIHDLIPIRYPQTCAHVVLEVFEQWLRLAIDESDLLICVSKSVANDLAAYITESSIQPSHKAQITYSHHGADIPASSSESTIRSVLLQSMKDQAIPMFLMVGTLEPRKGHRFVLDAFEELWQEGYGFKLIIMGKVGWNVEVLVERIKHHPELNKRLLFIENPTDGEINLGYLHTTALIAASIAEGFGLPIVEAALYDVPVIAGDISVFHEVGGDGALYFSLKSPSHLASVVRTMAQMPLVMRREMAQKVRTLTWKESARNTRNILYNNCSLKDKGERSDEQSSEDNIPDKDLDLLEEGDFTKQKLVFHWLLGREGSDEAIKALSNNCKTVTEFIWKILLSKEGLDLTCEKASQLHLHFIHNARLKAIQTLIPDGDVILDLGGAASPLYRMGYSYNFKKLTLIDLPLDLRYADYKDVNIDYEGQGEVIVHYSNMMDLNDFADNSVDLVWSGQSIEHINQDDGLKMCKEAYRVLKNGGYFCLDTPNRLITSIHTGRPEGMINPDHKHEYTPTELRTVLEGCGFIIVKERGICEMPITSSTGQFSYKDFVIGSPISSCVDQSYIIFLVCQKRDTAVENPIVE